jgi:thiopurine S-methyltransferase
MSWMADMGHTIVGVEISPVAIEQFFNENEIEYDVNPFELMKGTVYTSKNGNIRIYCGDFAKSFLNCFM